MKNASLHFRFSSPGNWGEFVLTALFTGRDGFIKICRYTQDSIPADQAPALIAVVAALVGLAEPWQAVQVWARLGHRLRDYPFPPPDGAGEWIEAVSLTVEAVNPQGGRRTFTATDYPDFIILDPAAVAFFKHFTKQ